MECVYDIVEVSHCNYAFQQQLQILHRKHRSTSVFYECKNHQQSFAEHINLKQLKFKNNHLDKRYDITDNLTYIHTHIHTHICTLEKHSHIISSCQHLQKNPVLKHLFGNFMKVQKQHYLALKSATAGQCITSTTYTPH